MSAAKLWERASEQLRAEMPASTYRLWIDPIEAIELAGKRLVLGASPNVASWIRRRYAKRIKARILEVADGQVEEVVMRTIEEKAAA